jgi:hypothetical protein
MNNFKKSAIFIFLFCFNIVFPNQNQSHFLSVCAIFKNEAPYFREWIEYHRLQGVEKFYLYNNDSSDNFLEILGPYIEKKVVHLTNWPTPKNAKNHTATQTNAYNDAIKNLRNVSQWIAFIDIDEFIVPMNQSSLKAYLHQFDLEPSVGAICVNWQLYGTSNINKLENDQLVTESFVMKAPEKFVAGSLLSNNHFKSIVRPNAVSKMLIHYATLKKGFNEYPLRNPKAKASMSRPLNIAELRINHYWTRDENFFYNVKIARKKTVFKDSRDRIINIASQLNSEEDRSIFRFLPLLKERMANYEICL